ncbi:putative carboxylesterase 17 [Apostasia shenzhenica]|uniref:Putative carboxylesterase 17 n=1 Tax=Apostasia shenzhenica TaxID=1088818 RepID=A0A2I0BAQ0_9ASPA|nr:putative carboxylesterase 17 [Apostasia shenzhenica]
MAPSPSAVVTAAAHNPVVEEIPGLIRLYKDGHVERLPAVPEVPPSLLAVSGVASADVDINPSAGLWARIYSPTHPQPPLPVIVYFHGGGFCVGSAAWRCYHDFLSRLAVSAASVVVSVNYRLAPENRLPAAYDDGLAAVKWLQQPPAVGVSGIGSLGSWRLRCSFDSVFLAGDSAGGAIAYNVALRLSSVRQVSTIQLI